MGGGEAELGPQLISPLWLHPVFTCALKKTTCLTAQVEVIAEGQGSAVHVLHAGGGEDGCVLPDTEWLEIRSRNRQLLPKSRPVLQRIHENLRRPQEAGTALQPIQRQALGINY